MSPTKKFSQHCFRENDKLGKNAGILHLCLQDEVHKILINLNRTGVDLTFQRSDGSMGSLECEVKRGWEGGPFPYKTINALGRKRKFFEAGADWILVSDNSQDYLVVSAADILASPMVAIRNQYVLEGELFYQVPLEKAQFFKFGMPIYALPYDCADCGVTTINCKDKTNLVCDECGSER